MRFASPCIALSLLLLMSIPYAWADGGVVQFQRSAGSYLITLFTTPTPLRVGAADLSVMVQNRETQKPMLDAKVRLLLRSANGLSLNVSASHDQAQNKLLYSSLVNIPESGQWRVEIDVNRSADSASIAGEIIVLPGRSPVITYWKYFLIPPFAILLFVLHQWLKNRL